VPRRHRLCRPQITIAPLSVAPSGFAGIGPLSRSNVVRYDDRSRDVRIDGSTVFLQCCSTTCCRVAHFLPLSSSTFVRYIFVVFGFVAPYFDPLPLWFHRPLLLLLYPKPYSALKQMQRTKNINFFVFSFLTVCHSVMACTTFDSTFHRWLFRIEVMNGTPFTGFPRTLARKYMRIGSFC